MGTSYAGCIGAFESFRKYHIYELNAHERQHKVVITGGENHNWIFFDLRVSVSKKTRRITMSIIDGKFVEIDYLLVSVNVVGIYRKLLKANKMVNI